MGASLTHAVLDCPPHVHTHTRWTKLAFTLKKSTPAMAAVAASRHVARQCHCGGAGKRGAAGHLLHQRGAPAYLPLAGKKAISAS